MANVPLERRLSDRRVSADLGRASTTESREAAEVLVRHLFSAEDRAIRDIAYAADYRLAIGRSGGDIVDAFPLADGSVTLLVADIAGKGPQASVQAALVKYALRGFASAGMSPAEALERLDRLYHETMEFERSNSFVTVFIGRLSPDRRRLDYASAGHDPIAIKPPGEAAMLLDVTAGAVGVLPEFAAGTRTRTIHPGTVLVLATDGVTESRRGRDFFGLDGFLSVIDRHGDAGVEQIARSVSAEALAFADGEARDDCAILTVRCLG